MDINLYFDKKDKLYYLNVLDKNCDACGSLLNDIVIIRVFWDKLGSGINYLCTKCKDKIKNSDSAAFTNTFMALITDSINKDCEMVLITKPVLSDARNLMIFDVESIGAIKTIDNTVYANRKDPQVKEYQIEEAKEDIDLRLGFKPLKDDELDNLFASHKNAKAITKDNRELLE